jgi:hypothetical protein
MGYYNADCSSDENDRKSTSGYAFFLGNGVVSWNNKCQYKIPLSTTKAEYMCKGSQMAAATFGGCKMQARWRDYGQMQQSRCHCACKNLVYHIRINFINFQYHFIRKKVERRMISLENCPTNHMMVDALIKVLARDRYEKLIEMMGFNDFGYLQSENVNGSQ